MGKEFLLPTLQLHVRYFIYISMLWTLTSEKHMATQIVGSIQLLTNHKLRKLSKTFNFAKKWLNLTQKRWQMQAIKRARRRTKNQKRKKSQKKRKRKSQSQWTMNQNQSNRRIHLRLSLRVILIWMTSKDSILIMMKWNQFRTFGKNSTKNIIQSGGATTSTPMN